VGPFFIALKSSNDFVDDMFLKLLGHNNPQRCTAKLFTCTCRCRSSTASVFQPSFRVRHRRAKRLEVSDRRLSTNPLHSFKRHLRPGPFNLFEGSVILACCKFPHIVQHGDHI
jgi:hypothetical protein